MSNFQDNFSQNQNLIQYIRGNNLVIQLQLNLLHHGARTSIQGIIVKKHIQAILRLNQRLNFINKK
jgi:hypothetical protein